MVVPPFIMLPPLVPPPGMPPVPLLLPPLPPLAELPPAPSTILLRSTSVISVQLAAADSTKNEATSNELEGRILGFSPWRRAADALVAFFLAKRRERKKQNVSAQGRPTNLSEPPGLGPEACPENAGVSGQFLP